MMQHHKPYKETWYDYALAFVIALTLACLMFDYFEAMI